MMIVVPKLFSIIFFFHEIPNAFSRNTHGNIVGDPVKIKRLVKLSLNLNKTISSLKDDVRCYPNQSFFIDVVHTLESIFRWNIIYVFHIRLWSKDHKVVFLIWHILPAISSGIGNSDYHNTEIELERYPEKNENMNLIISNPIHIYNLMKGMNAIANKFVSAPLNTSHANEGDKKSNNLSV